MNARDDFLTQALTDRLKDLFRGRVRPLVPESYGEAAPFASQVRERLMNSAFKAFGDCQTNHLIPNCWMNSETDCLSSLQALSLGQPLKLRESEGPSVDSFLQMFREHRRDSARSFRLLTERYACPLNFTLPAEDRIREHVLMRLMVQDRAIIESQPVTKIDADDLLLKLNLIAVQARATSDLRFLDALNYYYELLPADWIPPARHGWLIVSYLALYARALAIQILRKQTVAPSHTLEQPAAVATDL